ncbi:type II toxin-antitoxin system PemK/MazF family toxin [Demequina capsici]|uniref:Type II toxin-antitoxin system PemK/MazF family toxin n=1 Tax=Demequina capsici TaxID=3075620 RepID=A0AA96FET2_9MICO|nr:type II toxin-antitoxin system PemK/MazF family toxin [Demequina sp. PMTSA13]WNM28352.1 type II toxin-antitoxin system PemK/MazF family toxin [Demequina sp. PMTSA13]
MTRARPSLPARLLRRLARALSPARRRSARRPSPPRHGRRYPGDYTGKVDVRYAPRIDGAPDPGEIVWTWVPFEEDHSQGKDRPVLLIGHDGRWLLGLQLSSQDHGQDAVRDARWGRRWVGIGAGSWDRQRRASYVRLDRIVRVDPGGVRREGASLDRARFEAVSRSLSEHHRW